MKTLIIGNSHVGAVIKAYKDNPSVADIQFLAVNGNSLLQNLNINERCELISDKQHITDAIAEQGLQGVSLNDFDFIMIYGCQLRAAGSGEHWINKMRHFATSYSSQVRHAAHTDFVRDTAHYRFLERVSSWPLGGNVNVVSIPSPLPNELVPFGVDMPPVDKASIAEILDFVKNEIESVGFVYLDTPTSLLSDNGYTTKAIFKASWIHDTAHLNTAGGHEVLNQIATFLETAGDTLDHASPDSRQKSARAA